MVWDNRTNRDFGVFGILGGNWIFLTRCLNYDCGGLVRDNRKNRNIFFNQRFLKKSSLFGSMLFGLGLDETQIELSLTKSPKSYNTIWEEQPQHRVMQDHLHLIVSLSETRGTNKNHYHCCQKLPQASWLSLCSQFNEISCICYNTLIDSK